jgi:hypothetical protein
VACFSAHPRLAGVGPSSGEHLVKAGAEHHFGFVIRPLGAKAGAAELARVSLNELSVGPYGQILRNSTRPPRVR